MNQSKRRSGYKSPLYPPKMPQPVGLKPFSRGGPLPSVPPSPAPPVAPSGRSDPSGYDPGEHKTLWGTRGIAAPNGDRWGVAVRQYRGNKPRVYLWREFLGRDGAYRRSFKDTFSFGWEAAVLIVLNAPVLEQAVQGAGAGPAQDPEPEQSAPATDDMPF